MAASAYDLQQKLGQMVDTYQDYCTEHGLPKMSADELILEDASVGHRPWLQTFIEDWDKTHAALQEAYEREALA